jgi:hypothetical protein
MELQLEQLTDIDGLVRALAENKSLVRLHFVCTRIRDDKWTELCQSLSRHPKLVYLCLFHTFPCRPHKHFNERKTRRMEKGKTRRANVFLKMLQANSVLQELDAPRQHVQHARDEVDERILSDVIQPYFRRLAHVRAFGSKHHGLGYAQLLARALYKVNDSPALVWMLIHSSIPTIMGFGEEN